MEANNSQSEIGRFAFEDFTGIAMNCFKVCGLILVPVEDVDKRARTWTFIKSIYFWFAIINVIVSIGFLVTFVLINIGNPSLVSSALPNVANAPFIVFKVMMVYKHRHTIAEVMAALMANFPVTKEEQESVQVEKYLKTLRIFLKFCGGFMVVVYLFLVVHIFETYFIHGTEKLPLEMWLPFSYREESLFFLVSFWLLWISFIVEVLAFGVDVLLFAFVTLIIMNFDTLKTRFENITADSASTIKDLISKQLKIMELCDKLEDIYSAMTLYNFMQSSILICFIAFQLSSATELSMVMLHVPYLITACNQILLTCYLGQKLTNSSFGVSVGTYNCAWYMFKETKWKKAVYLCLLRSQRPKCLTAKKFRVVSLESFTSVR